MKEITLNRTMRKDIGIAGLIVVAMMLAMVPTASADSREVMGIVAFENGTWVPDGWPGWSHNVNVSYSPVSFTTEVNPFGYNIFVCDQYDSEDNYFEVNCTSPDGKWFGKNTRRYGDVYDPVSGCMIINVTVYEVPVETENFTKPLSLGWNLISLPLAPLDNSASAVLGNDTIAYDAVKSYNAATHQFEDATTMDPGTGYFVYVTTAGDWVYEGTAVDSTSTGLQAGLNMVGVLNCTKNVSDTMTSIAGNYRYVARWNTTANKFEVYNPNAPSAFHHFDTMTAGEGYFVSAKTDCTLDVTCTS